MVNLRGSVILILIIPNTKIHFPTHTLICLHLHSHLLLFFAQGRWVVWRISVTLALFLDWDMKGREIMDLSP